MYEIWNRLQYVLSPQFDIYEKICRHVQGDVADIGSGTGFGTHLLTRNARRVRGYEIDKRARTFAHRAFSNGAVQFYEADITNWQPWIPLTGAFDFVVMIDVIEHIAEDFKAVENCKKLLKPNGVFICSTPNRLCRYRKSENHVREYEPLQLLSLIKKKFRYVSIRDYTLRANDSDYINPIIAVCKDT